jgi:hypothetical protein
MLLIAMVGLVVAGAGASNAAVTCVGAPPGLRCVINNGLAPPNPENVINDATYSGDMVYVRNVGCPPGWPGVPPGVYTGGPCPEPWGQATEVLLTDGGSVGSLGMGVYDSSIITINGGTTVYVGARESSTVTMTGGSAEWAMGAGDSATLTMSGGSVGYLTAGGASTVTLSGGTVKDDLKASGNSVLTMTGGTVWGGLSADQSATVTMSGGTVGLDLEAWSGSITILGRDFEVDGVPARYLVLPAQTGTLSGTLASGDPINNVFYHGGIGDYGGLIFLEYAPEPTQALLYAFALVTLALLRRRAA